MKKWLRSFRLRLERFSGWCSGVLFEGLIEFNFEVVTEVVPRALKEVPLAWALLSWLLFSVLWIAAAGPITFVIEAVLFPFAMYYENVCCSGESRKPAWWKTVFDLLCMTVLATILFWIYRFVGCAIAFDEGILKPRRRSAEVDS